MLGAPDVHGKESRGRLAWRWGLCALSEIQAVQIESTSKTYYDKNARLPPGGCRTEKLASV